MAFVHATIGARHPVTVFDRESGGYRTVGLEFDGLAVSLGGDAAAAERDAHVIAACVGLISQLEGLRDAARARLAERLRAGDPTCWLCGQPEGLDPATTVAMPDGSLRVQHDLCAERAS